MSGDSKQQVEADDRHQLEDQRQEPELTSDIETKRTASHDQVRDGQLPVDKAQDSEADTRQSSNQLAGHTMDQQQQPQQQPPPPPPPPPFQFNQPDRPQQTTFQLRSSQSMSPPPPAALQVQVEVPVHRISKPKSAFKVWAKAERRRLADETSSESTVKLTSYMQNDKRRISMPPKDCSAVEVRRLRYVVGRRKQAKVILTGINMTVPEGTIYGLLGPSGSGKTTLLKSVVGQLTPSEGWVKVFGFQPNQPGSQIPGAAIGYMPQELAVYEDFTIKETLWYFGRLYRIPAKLIKERIEFLLTFLDLPRSSRLILNMSGGQKRRVSLASALVHSPPLLILDEPTVGVDPLLRQSIWQHLVTLTQTEKITVIVTTHYIEEARRANIVGLMRRGRLLAENAPEELMAKHDSSSLEDVFLKLCVTDTMRRAQKFASLTGMPVQEAIMGTSSAIPTPEIQSRRHHEFHHPTDGSPHHVTSLTDDSGASGVSQSPDEGVNTSSGGHNSSNSSSGDDSTSSTSNAAGDSDLAPASDGQGKPSPGHVSNVDLGDKVGWLANMKSAGNGPSGVGKKAPGAKRFQLKSLLRVGGSKTPELQLASEAQRKNLERRRQSGSHFIEQLMCKYEQDRRQGIASGAPLDQLLSCDTSKQPQHQQQQQQAAASSAAPHHLQVPKISIHGGQFNDSGASSNSSSQAHSPVESAGKPTSKHKRRPAALSERAAYANHSYQPSEFNLDELALVPAGGPANQHALNRTDIHHDHLNLSLNNTHHHQQQHLAAADNNSHYSVQIHHEPTTTTSMGNSGLHQHLDDDVMLDPELFMDPNELSTMSPGGKYDYKKRTVGEYCETIRTITWKNYIRLKRNVPLLLFQFVLPAIQVVLFCICVGNDPFDISVAIVNEESSADSIAALSTQFLNSIDSHLVKQVNFHDLPSAIESVRRGKNWGVVHIPENFTISIHKRFAGLEGELDDATLENSTIKVYPDMTNQPIGHAMEVAFRRAYRDLSKQTFEFLGLNAALTEPPIRMQEAIYGKIDIQNYLQYMSPGVLISISYIMATGLTSLAFIIERRDGLYDRTLAAGVDHMQMLLSHSIVQLLVMIVQISLVVFFTFVIYKVPTNGPFVWVFLLLLLQGLAGMTFGLMVSAICKEENTAIMMILGTFYPNLLLAGVIWPIEAIPYWLRWFSYLQPQTLPTQSLRNLIVRGWDIDQPGVWSGFAVTSAWLLLFLAISCLAFKIRK